MPKLDYDKLTTEQADRIHALKAACGEGLDAVAYGNILKDLILSIDPELALAEKREISDLAIGDVDQKVHHVPSMYAVENHGEIPPILAQLTAIVVHAHALNGDLGYLADVMKSPDMYLGSFIEETKDQTLERLASDDEEDGGVLLDVLYPEKPEALRKVFMTAYVGDDGERHDNLIGPFDTVEDGKAYAKHHAIASPEFLWNDIPRCDEDGNWVD